MQNQKGSGAQGRRYSTASQYYRSKSINQENAQNDHKKKKRVIDEVEHN
jgi:hypothetical protein